LGGLRSAPLSQHRTGLSESRPAPFEGCRISDLTAPADLSSLRRRSSPSTYDRDGSDSFDGLADSGDDRMQRLVLSNERLVLGYQFSDLSQK